MELVLKSTELNLPAEIENLEALKAELLPMLEHYNSLVVTEDSIKAAKADKAKLNKLKTAIEDQRKAIKKQYLEPYNVLEAQCKEVVSLIDGPIEAINNQIKVFDDKEKEVKLAELTDIFNSVPHESWLTLEDVLNPKWANKTEKIETLSNEIKASCQKFNDEYAQLEKLYENFPHKLAIIERFKSSKDFSQTMVYAKTLEYEFEKQQRESVENAQEQPSSSGGITTLPEVQTGVNVQSEQNEGLVTGKFEVIGTRSLIKALGQWMRENGVRFRIIK